MLDPDLVRRHTSHLIRNRYWAREPISHGGLGIVYSGWDEELQRPVAVKRLRADVSYNQRHGEAAWNEAQSLARLQHPNIVTLFDFGKDEEGVFFIMELVPGQELEEWLQSGPLDLEDFMPLAEQSLAGLGTAHVAGILHLDLKTANLMVSRGIAGRLQVKLLDFGLSKFQPHHESSELNQESANMGSMYYAAPELIQKKQMDQRTDLYSLGHIFYQALAGAPAFASLPVDQILLAQLKREAPPLRKLRPDLDPSLCAWVHRFIHKSPGARPASAEAALRDLDLIRQKQIRPDTGNFDSPLCMVVSPDATIAASDLQPFVDRDIRLTGTLEEKSGTMRLVLKQVEDSGY